MTAAGDRTGPPEVVAEHFAGELEFGERVWHERLGRRLKAATVDARHRSLVHAWLAIVSGRPRWHELVDGRCHWHVIGPDRQAELGRVLDELGERVGIGPKP